MPRREFNGGDALDLIKGRYVRGSANLVSQAILLRFRHNIGPDWKRIFDSFGVFSKKGKGYRKYQYLLSALHYAMTEGVSKRKILDNLSKMLELLYV